jgi:hypothetical protein
MPHGVIPEHVRGDQGQSSQAQASPQQAHVGLAEQPAELM